MTLLQVNWFSFLGPLLAGTYYCKLGTPHKTCCFGDAFIQPSSHHHLAIVKVTQITFFVLPTHKRQELTVHLLHKISITDASVMSFSPLL